MPVVQIDLDRFLAELPERLIGLALQAGLAALVLLLGIKITHWLERWGAQAMRRAQPEDSGLLVLAVRRVISVGGISLTVLAMLSILGVNINALIAGLGLTSAALAFALKDTIEQAITGVVLLFQRPFKVGDVIEIEGVEGIVEDVAIRTTNIRTFDGLHVLVPNNRVYQGVIRNKSHYTTRRWQLTFGLAYDTDLPKAHAVILEAVNRTPGVLPEPAATISFENFDAGSIRAIVRYWLEPARTDPGEAQNAVVSAITEAARVENIAIPLPIQMPQVHPPDSSNGTAGTAGAAGAAHPALAGTPPATK